MSKINRLFNNCVFTSRLVTIPVLRHLIECIEIGGWRYGQRQTAAVQTETKRTAEEQLYTCCIFGSGEECLITLSRPLSSPRIKALL